MDTAALTDQATDKNCMQAACCPNVCAGECARNNCLIVNADDWGRDSVTTNRILNCVDHNTISSVSAMVFMEDSERAAEIAQGSKVNVGLHLNFTLAHSAASCPAGLLEHQQRIARVLMRHKLAPAMFYPWLARSFEYVVKAQVDEFSRLYGTYPERIDGHHHMHLCANVLRQRLLPGGIVVRRNLSFGVGEKSRLNRMYRSRQDARLSQRYKLTDFFFDLSPVKPLERLKRICKLAAQFCVEVEAHPIREEEYAFMMNGGFESVCAEAQVARGYIAHMAWQNYAARSTP
jgi:chitin disaccharide deacetylase